MTVEDQIRNRTSNRVLSRVITPVGYQVANQVGSQLDKEVWNRIGSPPDMELARNRVTAQAKEDIDAG